MNQKLLATLNESEQALLRETEPSRLNGLDEDELLDPRRRSAAPGIARQPLS
ncbi:MAG TPA: hypothetical protein VJM33_10355 [Microthrixaceae bacterium]|nr:hypothetical protein [Microthrixaceae bacterium]